MLSTTLKHFSHPEHVLRLEEDNVFGDNAKCYACNKSVIGFPTYTCTNNFYVDCKSFYLHKNCAQLPTQIVRDEQDPHPLTLLARGRDSVCDICNDRVITLSYACEDCDFDVCVVCAFISEQGVIRHQGHAKHTLTLQRQALFKCDACYEKTEDYSYVCFTCNFWIHKRCAFSPPIIPAPSYHHHPVILIYSIPVMHRKFIRYCPICDKRVLPFCWFYYCHKCTFFVHIKCASSTVNEIEENENFDSRRDFVQFPLPSEESLLDLIISHCGKLRTVIQGEGENSTTIVNDPRVIYEHWSHREHPLEMQQFTENGLHDDDDNDNDDDDKRGLICDGCIQPITSSHVSYYACKQCRFFLHSFCATKLPQHLPVGGCPFHPQHSFKLNKVCRFYDFFLCGVCSYFSNGFYYQCEACHMKIEIRCAFLPTRIRHKSHKRHSLVQRRASDKTCSVSRLLIDGSRLGYACETCNNFHIFIGCVFYPTRMMKHRYDDHPITLRHPPFFYEGVIYCEICEEQVNNQLWLYHCGKCDHSFHYTCLRWYESVKVGRTIKYNTGNQIHTLTLVLKRTTRRKSLPYLCVICGQGYKWHYFFECFGCGYLACVFCIRWLHGE
ncbi:hypothetical protein DCAR_0209670 [Daucus carota subsp. sativus]|uniref:Phorbol-ester/DAG-type domain-containing protein n=1 Tax=Daucus carota subsp. sativus TaxID=79200 RepID=A0AAF0WJD7_DAUCS|nr:hypothetical protein DCAR_0209670 [Daucus carota subsp. sativus]